MALLCKGLYLSFRAMNTALLHLDIDNRGGRRDWNAHPDIWWRHGECLSRHIPQGTRYAYKVLVGLIGCPIVFALFRTWYLTGNWQDSSCHLRAVAKLIISDCVLVSLAIVDCGIFPRNERYKKPKHVVGCYRGWCWSAFEGWAKISGTPMSFPSIYIEKLPSVL